VSPTLRVSLALAGAGAAAALGSAAVIGWRRLHRKKSPEEVERLRRLDVNRRGRITTGKVLDLIESGENAAPSRVILYKYEVRGVTYEAAQDITLLPGIAPSGHYPAGQTASIKFDPQQPTNSIVACEEWCGIKKQLGD